MFSQFLVKKFIKNSSNIKDEKIRTQYGFLGGLVGIIANLILFGIKLFVGILSNSITATADAFNNLSDSASSIITILGFKLSNMPADEEHPFGHGRIEYLSGLIVAFMVMLVGYEFLKSSFSKIFHPSLTRFQLIPFILILLSILIKVWLARFNNYIGTTIDSSALKASSWDAVSDVITSSLIVLSLIASKFTTLPVDGYLGILVSLFLLYSGFKLVMETINPLLGSAPDKEMVEAIKSGVMSYEYITGVHDLIIHNYGPGKYMASIHAEVPYNINIVKIHDIIDIAEKELSEKLNIYLVIHMDPLNVDDEEIKRTKSQLIEALKAFPSVKSIHDFRIIGEGSHKRLIFDIVVDSKEKWSAETESNLRNDICKAVKNLCSGYDCIITIDKDFSM